jgi:hypothetical protein
MRSPALLISTALRRFALALLALAGAAPGLRAQAAIHEWTFDNRGSIHTLASFGWSGWGARNDERAVNYTATISFDSTQPRLGRIKNIKSADGTMLLAASTGTGEQAKNRFVAVVEFAPLSIEDDRLGSVTWSQASTSLDGGVRLLVRCGDKWYASPRTFTNAATSGIATVTNAELHSLDLAGPDGLANRDWHRIAFGDHIPIEVASAPVGAPLGRVVSGIGFLIEFDALHDRRIYIDNVIVGTSIP